MRIVQPADALELARLIQVVWPHHHNPNPERIARVSLESNHVTLVETDNGMLTGFVDSFATAGQDGAVRWEVDLLGVHPDYRGRGIAQALVHASVQAGRDFGAQHIRALVKLDNAASLNTFRRCGFALDETICDLCISDRSAQDGLTLSAGAHLVPVSTLTYSGIWIEGEQTQDDLRAGLVVRTRYGWDVAGAVIPVGTHEAETLGYEIAGQYLWLRR